MNVHFIMYSAICTVCLFMMGCADLVQTRRVIDGKETILWTNKSNLERMELEDAQRQQQVDYFQSLPKRPLGQTITIALNAVTVDENLKQSFHEDDFMNRLRVKFDRNPQYHINSSNFMSDLEIDTHVQLSKEVGLTSEGKLGQFVGITIVGTVKNRYYPDRPYEVKATADIFHNVEAIEEYYKKIDDFIQNDVAPMLPDLSKI